MAALTWDTDGTKQYHTGTKQGVLYTAPRTTTSAKTTYNAGVAWNGLTGVTETPSGAEANDNYADDIKYISIRGAEKFDFTVEAFMAPDEWAQCDGTRTTSNGLAKFGQQERSPFGMAFISTLGNDTEKNDFGFEIHLEYNATASPSERAYKTIGENPELITFSWECTSDPVAVSASHAGVVAPKPTSNVIITCSTGNGVLRAKTGGGWEWNLDTDTATANGLKARNAKLLYLVLFGMDQSGEGEGVINKTSPTLPNPDAVYDIVNLTTASTTAAEGLVATYALPDPDVAQANPGNGG